MTMELADLSSRPGSDNGGCQERTKNADSQGLPGEVESRYITAIRFLQAEVLRDVSVARTMGCTARWATKWATSKVGYTQSGLHGAHHVWAKWATRKGGYK